MSFTEKLERNVKVLTAHRAATAFVISLAVIVPYWNGLGLDQAQIYQLQAIFLVTLVALEVPSGYFADFFGRRRSIVYGQVTATLAWIGYALAGNFWQLALAEGLLAVGASLISGANKAHLYDTLKALGRAEDENLKTDSRAEAYGAISEGAAGILGGGLAVISLYAPLVGQAVWAVVVLPIPFLLVEPPRTLDNESTDHPWRALVSVVKYSLHGNKSVKWLIIYAAATSSLTHTVVWLMQPYYLDVGFQVGLAFGILWFLKHIFLATFFWFAEPIKNWLGLRQTLILLPVVGIATYLVIGIGYSLWVLPAFIGFELVRGVIRPVMGDEVNKLIPSGHRATVNSVEHLAAMLGAAVFGLVIGQVASSFSTQAAMLASAAIYGPICLLALGGLLRAHHKLNGS